MKRPPKIKIQNWPWAPADFTLLEDVQWDSGLSFEKDWTSPDGLMTIQTNGMWIIRKGFRWNGSTWVPDGRIDPATGLPITWKASCYHDCGYRYLFMSGNPMKKHDVDKSFHTLLLDVYWKYSELYYQGVKYLGWFAIASIWTKTHLGLLKTGIGEMSH